MSRGDNGWTGTKNRDGDRIPSMAELRAQKDSYKDERGVSRAGATRFKYCRACKEVEPVTSECFEAPENDRIDAPNVRTFTPYWDPNIAPKTHGGLPVLVRSARHKRELLKANGLTHIG